MNLRSGDVRPDSIMEGEHMVLTRIGVWSAAKIAGRSPARTKMRLSGLLVLIAALAASGVPGPLQAAESKAELEQLSWMAGTWKGKVKGTVMEEHWTAPGGGIMLGLHRDIRPDGGAFFEYLRIEVGPEGIAYVASPRGGPATAFLLKSAGEKSVVFENLEHDFPQRILYWLDEEGALVARIEGEENGETSGREWRWRAVR